METSDFKVTVVIIDDILNHPNADRLEVALVGGWNCVVRKGEFKKGDAAIYFPIDSVLREDTEVRIFGPNSKVSLHNHRVKTIKLRGAISQGLLVPLSVFPLFNSSMVGVDLTEIIGVKKYEPKAPSFQKQCSPAAKKYIHPDFATYTKWGNINNLTGLFQPDDIVIVTEKLHGTNARFGWLPYKPKNFFQKILKFFGLMPKWEFVFGSHNVQISNKMLNTKGVNVYADMVNKYDLMNKIPKGIVVYGEIYGDGIQKNFSYGLKTERELRIFDIQCEGKYLSWDKFLIANDWINLPVVPVLYKGPFSHLILNRVINGPSRLCDEQKTKEGVVVKTVEEERCHVGRKGAKIINPEYLLLKDNTDFH